jgi:hypothetical protein
MRSCKETTRLLSSSQVLNFTQKMEITREEIKEIEADILAVLLKIES